jgi:hypothetical protein
MCYLAAAVKMHRLKVCGGEEGQATLHIGEGLLCLLDRTNALGGFPLLWRQAAAFYCGYCISARKETDG